MAPERVTITVRSPIGEEGPLTVRDALQQVLDFFDLLTAAQGGVEGAAIAWNLITISKTSPLSATGEAYSTVEGMPAEPIARKAKTMVADSIEAITNRGRVPEWMDDVALSKVHAILDRTVNGIGRTDIQFYEDEPLTVIVERTARVGLLALVRAKVELEFLEPDLSRTEMGSVEGFVIDTTTYHRNPAIRITNRITGQAIMCVLADSLAERIGPLHSWSEVWTARRVLVVGQISYRKDGNIIRINATDIQDIEPQKLDYHTSTDPNFTGGLEPKEYLDMLWEEDNE